MGNYTRSGITNPGLTVTFIDKIDDVTDYVKAELAKDKDPNSMNYLSPSFLNKLAEKKVGKKFLQNNPGTGWKSNLSSEEISIICLRRRFIRMFVW